MVVLRFSRFTVYGRCLVPVRRLGQCISVDHAFERQKTRSDLLTRNAYTVLNNKAQEVRALCLL